MVFKGAISHLSGKIFVGTVYLQEVITRNIFVNIICWQISIMYGILSTGFTVEFIENKADICENMSTCYNTLISQPQWCTKQFLSIISVLGFQLQSLNLTDQCLASVEHECNYQVEFQLLGACH